MKGLDTYALSGRKQLGEYPGNYIESKMYRRVIITKNDEKQVVLSLHHFENNKYCSGNCPGFKKNLTYKNIFSYCPIYEKGARRF